MMLKTATRLPLLAALLVLMTGYASFAATFTMDQWQSVQKISNAIRVVQPRLDKQKLTEYASGIYRASRRYDIDPYLLVAIAFRETSFRENLPEGKAGELGICQIRKMWVHNPQFQAEFGKIPEQELLRPARSFLFAAWILSELRTRERVGALPYWSYYNSVKFHNRFKYYIPVNRSMVMIKQAHGPWAGTEFEREVAELPSQKYWTAKNQQPLRRMAAPRNTIPVTGWIAAALKKLDQQEQPTSVPDSQPKTKKRLSTATMQAAVELGVRELLTTSVQD
jgi:hypothetical protein